MIKQQFSRILGAALIAILAFGIGATYEDYRGTDHSRVPRSPVSVQKTHPTGGISTQTASAATIPSKPSTPSDFKNAPPVRSTPPPMSLGGNTHELKLYPSITKGMRTPFDLWRYYGRGRSSFGSPVLPMRFEQWLEFHRKQKPQLMADVREYMSERYSFSGEPISGQYMSGGKPIMRGPVARLPKGIDSFEQLASMPVHEIRERDLFPFKPLAHPLQSVAHMVFPPSWVKAHPEHARIDVDHDLPESYLPERCF